jgi:hypothetical protein
MVRSSKPNDSSLPDKDASWRRDTTCKGLTEEFVFLKNSSSTITLPGLTDLINTRHFSIPRMTASPEIKEVRLSESSENDEIEPESFMMTSGWSRGAVVAGGVVDARVAIIVEAGAKMERMGPARTEDDVNTSALVEQLTTPIEAPVMGCEPKVRPVRTTVTEAPALIEPLDTVTTVRVLVGTEADAVAATPSPLISTPGVPTAAKKPCGYVRVMLLPEASAPPGDVLKLSVARTLVLPTTRSMAARLN